MTLRVTKGFKARGRDWCSKGEVGNIAVVAVRGEPVSARRLFR